ncbi:MAG: RimK family protein, partial [Giesbergeria sp.]
AIPLDEVPPEVLHAAISSTRLVGNSFYGVDLKSTPSGVFVIEINDNPNLDVGVEDAALGDALYVMLLSHFLKQVELRFNSSTARSISQGSPCLALAAG